MNVLISGASSGIGRQTALLFAERGHKVLVAARRVDELKKFVKQNPALVDRFIVSELDVCDPNSVKSLVSGNLEFFEKLDLLVNNAGLAVGREAFQRSEINEAETMLETNVMGLLRLTHAVLPFMIKRKSGQIINLGSVAGISAYASGTVYCATKAAVHMITDALRLDLGGTGIRVSTVAPGRVSETEFSVVRFKGDKAKAASVYEGFRNLTAREVAESVAWIAERPAHINIQELVILSTDQPSASVLAPLKE